MIIPPFRIDEVPTESWMNLAALVQYLLDEFIAGQTLAVCCSSLCKAINSTKAASSATAHGVRGTFADLVQFRLLKVSSSLIAS
jgi:hypothetical protein